MLADGTRIPASGRRVDGFSIDTAPDVVVEACIEGAPRPASTYRAAGDGLAADACIVVGPPSILAERRAASTSVRVAIALCAFSIAATAVNVAILVSEPQVLFTPWSHG